MSLNNFSVTNFFKNGFYVYKNLLDKDEIKKIQESFEEKKRSIILKKKYLESDDERCWDYLTNKRLLEIMRKMLGQNIYYMHDLNLVEHTIDDQTGTWHRDSPCRRTGIGPDWDNNFPYNVITTITYLGSSIDTYSNLNLIAGSHKTNYKNTLSNKMRFLHWKMKNKSNFLFNCQRNIIENIIGKKIEYKEGDCVIFFANLYHMGTGIVNSARKNRQIIVSRFGGEGKHSKNYINYIFKHRKEAPNYSIHQRKDDFFNHLKKEKIFYPEPEKKIDIEGVFSNTTEY